jgi:hypothetical protein
MARRIFGPTKEEVPEERGELHNEELHSLRSSLNYIE